MSDGLAQLGRYINDYLSGLTHPLYLVIDGRRRLVEARGDPAHFGLPTLEPGVAMDRLLPLLATLDPADREAQVLRFVGLPGQRIGHVHILPLDSGWGIALLDATDEHDEQQSRQQAAHELALLRDERERLLDELREANRLKGEFIARMSHEFRTPLTSVIGYGEQLREICSADAAATHHVGAVVRGGRYLLNLVENLLDQARIEIDTLRLNPAACDLRELSEQVEQLLRPQAAQKQLSLGWWFEGDLPPKVWLDGPRLAQVLINLVGNAIKFTREGGVNVEFDWQDGRLQVAVSDTGPGVPADQAERIFEPFRQADGTAHSKGAGLGLAISRSLVRAMGGDIALTSDAKGSRFAFDIEAGAVKAGGGDRDTLAGRRVLLVDDDPDLLDLFGLYLEAAGCSVAQASDAAQALTRARDFRPELVVLDLNLGDALGHDVARALRNAGFHHAIALLSATATDATPAAPDGLFDALWRKPIGRAQLLDGVSALIDRVSNR